MKMNCSTLESRVAIITKHKPSQGTQAYFNENFSNELYDVEIEAATGGVL